MGSPLPEAPKIVKMSLRSTLLLWNIGAIVAFALVCCLVLWFLRKGVGGKKDFIGPGFIERATESAMFNEPSTLKERILALNPPNGTSVAIFRKGQQPEMILGTLVPKDKLGLADAWNGDSNHRMVFRKSFVLWVPVLSENRVKAVVGYSFPSHMGPPTVWRNVIMALQGGVPATLVCLLIMFFVNRKLTAPLHSLARATEHLGEKELSYRVSLDGPKEFSNLADAFNKMAAKLEDAMEQLSSEKKRVEEVERSRRDFLADMSHNLGTPLSAIQSWVDQLSKGPKKSALEQRILCNKIRRQVSFLTKTSGRLLDLSRWEYSTPELYWQEFEIADPLFEAVESVEEAALENEIELLFDSVGHYIVTGDRTRLRELFQIFLENAIEYAGSGSVVEVVTEARSGRLSVKIRDNGKGIPRAQLTRLGERFRCSPGGGNGLGLAIADRLLKAMGTRLLVDSSEGVGTVISFELELAQLGEVDD